MVKKIAAFGVMLVMLFSLFSFAGCENRGFEFELINDDTEYRVVGYTGKNTAIAVPGEHKGKPVTEIGLSSGEYHHSAGIESIEVPASIKRICRSTITSSANLKTVTFASGSQLEIIDDMAFFNAPIRSVEVPASVISIGEFAFAWSGVRSVTFESGSRLEKIGKAAFSVCGFLESIVIPASVTSLGSSVFHESLSLKAVYFESGTKIENLGNQLFQNCSSLTDIYFGGTGEHWNAIDLGMPPISLYSNVTVHFNWSGE